MLTAYGSSKALLPKTEKNTNKTFSMLTVGDFNRIKSNILPTEVNNMRIKKNEELHKQSQARMRKWPDSIEMIKKTQMESRKKIFSEEEKRKRILDQEEARFKEYQKQIVNDRAEKLLFDNQDVVKSFKSNLLLTDVLNERDFQKEITIKKQEINKKIDEKWFEIEKEQMKAYDQRELDKIEEDKKKRNHQMDIISKQFKESKLKKVREYQDYIVEGEIIKKNAREAIEDEK